MRKWLFSCLERFQFARRKAEQHPIILSRIGAKLKTEFMENTGQTSFTHNCAKTDDISFEAFAIAVKSDDTAERRDCEAGPIENDGCARRKRL